MKFLPGRKPSILECLLFLILYIPTTFSSYWSGNTFYDLLDNSYAGLTAEAASWQLTLYYSAGVKVSYCNGYYIVGGYCILGGSGTSGSSAYYGQYFYRTYTGLPTHNQVKIKMTTYTVDSWDGTTADDHFEIGIDSYTFYALRMNGFDATYANTDLCGSTTYKDFPPFQIYFAYPHTSTSLTLKMITCCDENSCNESLGFRDISLEFSTIDVPYSSFCAISAAPLTSSPCPCENPATFMYPPNSGICVSCYSTCATCTGDAYNQCTSCYAGSYLSGGQCLPCNGNCATCSGAATTCTSCNSGWFLIGTTCYSSCNYPLYSYVSGGVTYCATPCPGQYVYWDQTCGSTCYYGSNAAGSYSIYASTVNTFLECNYPCSSTSQVLYWNGTCGSSCPSPLSSSVFHSATFCDYQCGSGQYLYWNGSCLDSCPSPLSAETEGTYLQRKFCWYTCQPNEYLYWNGSCLSSCPSPLTAETQGTSLQRKFCWYTCPPTQYLYWNGSCLSTCPSPLSGELQGTYLQRYFCWYTCQPSEYLYWNGSCLSTCPSPLSGETEGTYLQRKFCWYTCQPNEYLYWNGSCLSTCPSPLSGELEGTYLQRNFCWYTCQPSEYLLWNGTCSSTCPYPLSGELQGSNLQRNFCWYICMPWQWLYWDQTCQEDCTSPLWPDTQGTSAQRQFCWYPCTSESKFLFWNGTCSSECPEPLSTRYQNGQWFCDYPCSDTQYLYFNGSCLSSCPSPLYGFTEGTPSKKFCYYLCQVSEYLYWDGSCQSACNFPLVPVSQGDPARQYCWYLCSTNQYLYWNGTCSSQCDAPLTQRTTNSRKFCDYACSDDQYLAWNGSCLTTCPYPLSVRVEGSPIDKNYCDFPCAATKYLYWNGSCLDTCDSPLSVRIEGSPTQRKFCDYSCVGNQYLYWNGTCSTKCDLPLIIRTDAGNKFCDYLCPADQIMYWDGTCGTSCNSPLSQISQGTPTRQYCQYKCGGNQFLYWNGTCSDLCDSPLTSYVLKGRLFCTYPCTDSNDYLYYNGSCINSCPSPLSSRTESSHKFCDFPCTSSQFLYWNGTCLSGCDSPLTQIMTDGNLYCDFSCDSDNDYLYWNGTCGSECLYPLTSISEGNRKFCKFNCGEDEYLYWNQTCSETCDSPLISAEVGDKDFCYYPCEANQYLYWNGSCLSGCSSPLSLRVDAGLNYCDYPCSITSQYLYWNSSCLSECASPLSKRTESDQSYCDYPCTDLTKYLYWNSSCSSTCASPYKSKTESSRKYCQHPCDTSDYLYWNGSCLQTCDTPLLKTTDDIYKYCNAPCSDSSMFYYEELEKCSTTCHVPGFIDDDLGYLRCIPIEINEALDASASLWNMFLYDPLESGTLTIVKLVKIMQYVKYLNINMPPRLQRLGISKGRNVMSISSGITMGADMMNDFFKQSLPNVYEKNSLHSSFLVNFWEDLMTLVIAVGLACLFFIGERISTALEWKLAEIVCHTLRVLAKWNAVIMILAINLDDIILFSAVEYKTLKLGSGHSNGVSFAMSLIFIGLILGLSAFIYLYARKLRNLKTRRVNSRNGRGIAGVDESYQIIFRGFKDNNVWNQLFFLIYMFRIGVPMLIAVCLEVSPIAITILQVLISLGILTFLLKLKPFIKKINQQQIVLFEAIVLMMNFCMFILTILSMVGLHNTRGANVLGDIVIIGNDIINVMCLVFLVIKLYNEIKTLRLFIKKYSIKRSEATGLYLQLLFVPLQLGNMGFEEMISYDIPLHEANVKPVKFRRDLPNKKDSKYEMNEDKSNISFDYMENLKDDGDTSRSRSRDQRSFLQKKMAETAMFSPDDSKKLETFGDSPGLDDLESPEMMMTMNRISSPELQSTNNLLDKNSQSQRQKNPKRRSFLNVNFEQQPHENRFEKEEDELVDYPFDDSLKLSPSPSQEMNMQSNILSKLSHQEYMKVTQTGHNEKQPVRSILKKNSAVNNGTLNNLNDFEETLNRIPSHVERNSSNYASSPNNKSSGLNNRNPKETSMIEKNRVGAEINRDQQRSPQLRGKIIDYGDDYGGEGPEREDKKGWQKVKKHFNFGERSEVELKRGDSQMVNKSRLDENVVFNLWKSGKKHFKPNYK